MAMVEPQLIKYACDLLKPGSIFHVSVVCFRFPFPLFWCEVRLPISFFPLSLVHCCRHLHFGLYSSCALHIQLIWSTMYIML